MPRYSTNSPVLGVKHGEEQLAAQKNAFLGMDAFSLCRSSAHTSARRRSFTRRSNGGYGGRRDGFRVSGGQNGSQNGDRSSKSQRTGEN